MTEKIKGGEPDGFVAQVHKDGEWQTLPVGKNEYVFKTAGEASEYARKVYGNTQSLQVIPFKIITDE